MLLRYLVSNFLQQQGQSVVRDFMSQQVSGQAESDVAPEDVPKPEVIVLFALGVESAGFKEKLKSVASVQMEGRTVTVGKLADRVIGVVETGVGRKSAAAAARDVIDIVAPDWIISAGFAGGLIGDLKRGHVVMPNQVVDKEGNHVEIPLNLTAEQIEATPGLAVGTLLTVDRIIGDVAEKRSLGEQHSAVAVDMETLAIAQACQENEVKLISVRIISDAVDQPLPKDLEKMMSQKTTSGMIGAAAATIFNRPGSVKDMWNLNSMANKASDKLAGFLAGVIPQLDLAVRKREESPSNADGDGAD
ncbi:hypothetical protein DTL21_08965 [Bremerella cremea]|uniref:Nucleoside phosphorylase domain-containing protein n=1 Tax=Blastopirellula marina TaxID=124 RepID=A0A2S8FV33_9BACT|nr:MULTISPECIES: hypothetical protein [Pirellulaceae]PQO36046.1 hypothetical protein C5Y83_08960 [Blastopirellula marina]RCS48723.1 hypothetical protein DTL21_08965 [Bremerella cremea]